MEQTAKKKGRSNTLTYAAYQRLKEDICNGVIRSGSLLSEAQVAAQLGISRTPVREALAALESEGLVEIKRGIGAQVKPLSFSDVIHIYDLRKVLEPLAAQTAILHITEQDLKESRHKFMDLLKYKDEPFQIQVKKYVEADWDFHMLLVERCENTFIAPIMNMLQPTVRRLQVISYRPENYSVQEAIDQHLQLIEAIEERDVSKLCQQLRTHLSWSLAGFLNPTAML